MPRSSGWHLTCSRSSEIREAKPRLSPNPYSQPLILNQELETRNPGCRLKATSLLISRPQKLVSKTDGHLCHHQVLLEMGHGCYNSERGIAHYEQCLVICREISDLVTEADCLDHLGALQSYLGNTQASIKCWLDSLNLRRELGHVKGLRQCLEQLCLMYSTLEDWPQVTDFVSKLRDVAKQQVKVASIWLPVRPGAHFSQPRSTIPPCFLIDFYFPAG